MPPYAIRLRTLTPLWTGGETGTMDRVHETGIIGSLRWWYEAIVRGLGRYACDPSRGSCEYDEKKRRESICLACQVFGCTGYGRRFRLALEAQGNAVQTVRILSTKSPPPQHRGWFIPQALLSPLQLTFSPMFFGDKQDFEFALATVRHTLRFIENYGALGAKASQGQGVFSVGEAFTAPLDADAWLSAIESRPAWSGQSSAAAPDLRDFLGATVTLDQKATGRPTWWTSIPLSGLQQFRDVTWIPSAPAVRVQLRSWLRTPANIPNLGCNLTTERHRLMGVVPRRSTAAESAKGSDIYATHLYGRGALWQMRIFAFVPRHGNEVDRAVRSLLQDPRQVEPQVQSALGGITNTISIFPRSIRELLNATDKKPVQP